MKATMCVNKFIGLCPKCEEDTDTTHYPNNFDCPRYKAMTLFRACVIQYKEEKDEPVRNSAG